MSADIPRSPRPPERVLDEAAVWRAAEMLFGWECSPYLTTATFATLPAHVQETKLYDARLVIRTYLDAVSE